MSRELKIATADSRLATHWDNGLTTWEELKTRLADAHIGHTTVAQYHALPKGKQADAKDVGGFVGGHLAERRRRKGHVLARSVIALDIDQAPAGLHEKLPTTLPYEWVVYSTHSHRPESPRLRIIIPLTRDVTADEYEAIARRLAADIGINFVDDTTYEAHRLMYWPSHPIDGEFLHIEHSGAWVDPDEQLARYDDWRDVTTWPTSSRQAAVNRDRAERQADPLGKPGLVGAWCRAHTIHDAIGLHLGDIYTPARAEGRYTYTRGETHAGVVTYDDKFAYSHHGTDPAGGQLLNAFDLVRVHRFGSDDLDAKPNTPTAKLPSTARMRELAQNDPDVKRILARETLAQAESEFGDVLPDLDTKGESDDAADTTGEQGDDTEDTTLDWMQHLELTKSGGWADTLDNLTLIITHDTHLQEIRYDELAETITIRNPHNLPWTQIKPGWAEADIAQLKLYIERKYKLYSSAKTSEALAIAAASRAYHPIRDYLNGLPDWDGVERVDRLLVDYLGADDTEYVRAVTRKTLIAAVTRVHRPGTKFDTVLILNGPQGTGKSTLFAKLAGEWFSDALTLTDMRDKSGAEKLQGYWLLELGELAGMKKMEVEVVKGFLSRTDDKYRAAYARTVESHPRQCVIVGSTNAEDGFLRDVTGNRRFWPVTITGDTTHKSWALTPEDIAQIWAEVMAHYKAGEPLHLTGEVAEDARRAQDQAMETDDRTGLVEAWLDTPIPVGWDTWTLHQRRAYYAGEDASEFGQGSLTEETMRRETASNIEIWAECFGQDPAEMRPQRDGQEITAIMRKIDGWEPSGQRRRIALYGLQRLYQRTPDLEPPF